MRFFYILAILAEQFQYGLGAFSVWACHLVPAAGLVMPSMPSAEATLSVRASYTSLEDVSRLEILETLL